MVSEPPSGRTANFRWQRQCTLLSFIIILIKKNIIVFSMSVPKKFFTAILDGAKVLNFTKKLKSLKRQKLE